MERKDFLKMSIGFLGTVAVAPTLFKINTEESQADACSVTNSETAGPFPTITPSSYLRSNIVTDNRTGIPLKVNININNKNANCTAFAGAIVDIWHCDKDGYYSEYGGTGMQTVNYTGVHFLRGRQVTDANGLVSFSTIFPGWYNGRATHIHVHVYSASGASLLVTQIAFPEGANSPTIQVNSSTANGYTKGMNGYTYNSADNVFSDGVSNELATVTGSIANGYILNHSINVAGPALGVEEITFGKPQVGQNFPNPFINTTSIPIMLDEVSIVKMEIYELSGKSIGTPIHETFFPGINNITFDRNQFNLSNGYYIYKVTIENSHGVFSVNKKMLVK